MRLIRFLVDAFRQCFFEMARPSRTASSLFVRHSTVKSLSRLRVAFLNTRPNAGASRRRFFFWNRKLVSLVNRSLGFVVVTAAGALWCELRAAFGSPTLQYETPSFSRHSSAESVGSGALDLAGLKCTFHDKYLVKKPRNSGQSFRRPARLRRCPDTVNRRM